MGKFTTTSKREYKKNPDLIYLNPRILRTIKSEPNIRRCSHCQTILGTADKHSKYCSDWCREMGMINHLELHSCTHCDKQVPYGVSKCDECKMNPRKLEGVKRVPSGYINYYQKKQKDLIGHTCKSCNTYKEWSEFPTVRGAKVTRCRECKKEDAREYRKRLDKKLEL